MKFLGIDPGYARCGWGVIEDTHRGLGYVACGVIETDKNKPFVDRLLTIQAGMHRLVQLHAPDAIGIERPVHGPNVTNSVNVGAAYGAIILALSTSGLPTFEYWPAEVKAAVYSGNAKKAEVQAAMKLILRLDTLPKPDDAADGLAVAVCVASRYVVDMAKAA